MKLLLFTVSMGILALLTYQYFEPPQTFWLTTLCFNDKNHCTTYVAPVVSGFSYYAHR